jgi:O-antigen ligase
MNKYIHIGEPPLAPHRKATSFGHGPARRNGVNLWDILVFLIPLLQFVQIPVVGELLGPEVALLALAPLLVIMRGRRLFYPLPRTFLLLATLWLFSQIFTDVVRNTPFVDFSRGWAKIALALIAFSALYLLLYGHRRRIILFAAGLALGGILTYYLNPNPYAEYYWWKFGLGIPLSLLMVLLSTALNVRKLKILGIFLLVLGAFVNFYLDFRSLGAIMVLTACYQVLQAFMGRRGGAVLPRHLVVLGIVLGAVALATFKGYEYAAQEGLLGEDARQKYEMQSQGEYGLFLGGRSEILVSSRAILDSPLIGHGSWAKDCSYTNLLSGLQSRLGYASPAYNESCLIPAHSHIFGAWVEAGILGAVFWLWVLTLAVRVLLRLYRANERLAPVAAFFAFLLLWDLFFSPYGLELRYRTPYEVVLMMTFLPTTLRQRQIKPRCSYKMYFTGHRKAEV